MRTFARLAARQGIPLPPIMLILLSLLIPAQASPSPLSPGDPDEIRAGGSFPGGISFGIDAAAVYPYLFGRHACKCGQAIDHSGGYGFTGGIRASYPFFDRFSLRARLFFQRSLFQEEYTEVHSYVVLDPNDMGPKDILTRTRVSWGIETLSLELLGRMDLGTLPLYLLGGPSISIVTGNRFEVHNELLSTKYVYTSAGGRKITVADERESIPRLHAGMNAGAGISIPIWEPLIVDVEIIGGIELTNLDRAPNRTAGASILLGVRM